MRKTLILVLYIINLLGISVKAQRMQTITYNELPKDANSLLIREGILSQHAIRIKYKRDGKTVATIMLTEPIMVEEII